MVRTKKIAGIGGNNRSNYASIKLTSCTVHCTIPVPQKKISTNLRVKKNKLGRYCTVPTFVKKCRGKLIESFSENRHYTGQLVQMPGICTDTKYRYSTVCNITIDHYVCNKVFLYAFMDFRMCVCTYVRAYFYIIEVTSMTVFLYQSSAYTYERKDSHTEKKN